MVRPGCNVSAEWQHVLLSWSYFTLGVLRGIMDSSGVAEEIIFGTLKTRFQWEMEEDFRQMKDFWELSGFKSTKYNYITFHIIMIMALTSYLFFQIYKNLEEGQAYTGRSLPVAAKNYKETKPKEVVVYVGQYFGIFPLLEFLKIYAECTLEVRQLLDPVLAKV